MFKMVDNDKDHDHEHENGSINDQYNCNDDTGNDEGNLIMLVMHLNNLKSIYFHASFFYFPNMLV